MDPLTKKHHSDYVGGPNGATQFCYDATIPIYQSGTKEHRERLMRYNPSTAHEIITEAPFEAVNREALQKSAFLFEDRVLFSNEVLFE